MSADRRAEQTTPDAPAAKKEDLAAVAETSPPDVDSLMSRLDGSAPPSEQPMSSSDPQRPSAAELLGGRKRSRRGSTLRVPDDATPPPPPARRSVPPLAASPPTGALPVSAPVPPPAPEPPTLPAGKQSAAESQEPVRITPTRMISVGAPASMIPIPIVGARSEPRMHAAPIAEPPREESSVPSIVAAAASSTQSASSSPSQPPPRSQPPSRLATPYPMASPFFAADGTLSVPKTTDVTIKPVPVPAAAMSSQPIEPYVPRKSPSVVPPPPDFDEPAPNAPHAAHVSNAGLQATVREALDLLDREEFESTAIDIAVVNDDEPTAPRLPAVSLEGLPRPSIEPPPSEESLSDEEVEEVKPTPSAKQKQAAPPPRKPGGTGKMGVISASEATTLTGRASETANTLPSARVTEATPPPTSGNPGSTPSAAATSAPSTPSTSAIASVSTAAGGAPVEQTGEIRKKKRQWYEELFNDDFARTLPRVPPAYLDREVAFIDESLGCEKGATILDLGCGSGEHAVRLAKRGYEVIGIDLSLAMLARAADEAAEGKQRINFVQGDMRDLTFEEAFDGVYSWGTTFGYFDDAKNAEVIQKVHKALRRGGRLLLDMVNRDYVIGRQPSMAWFEGEGCVCMDEMSVNTITSRLVVKRTMMMEDGRQREIDYSIRLYALHELGKLLHDSGFRVAEASGDTSTPGVYFGAESPRILILAEKR